MLYGEVEQIVREFVETYEELPFGDEYRWAAVQNFINSIRREILSNFHLIPCPICKHPLIEHNFNKHCRHGWTNEPPMSGCMCGRIADELSKVP